MNWLTVYALLVPFLVVGVAMVGLAFASWQDRAEQRGQGPAE